MGKQAQRGQLIFPVHTASKEQMRESNTGLPATEVHAQNHTSHHHHSHKYKFIWSWPLGSKRRSRAWKRDGISGITSRCSDHKDVCDPRVYMGHTHANTTMCTAQSHHSLALWLILLTLTEKIFAVCPVCMESSFLWCSGSHTIVCWSSEPEASKLQVERKNSSDLSSSSCPHFLYPMFPS